MRLTQGLHLPLRCGPFFLEPLVVPCFSHEGGILVPVVFHVDDQSTLVGSTDEALGDRLPPPLVILSHADPDLWNGRLCANMEEEVTWFHVLPSQQLVGWSR